MTANELRHALRMQERLEAAISNFTQGQQPSKELWQFDCSIASWYQLFLWAALKKGIEL